MKMRHTTLWIASVIIIASFFKGYESRHDNILPKENARNGFEDWWNEGEETSEIPEDELRSIAACIYANKEDLKDFFKKLLSLKPLFSRMCGLDPDIPDLNDVICPDILKLIDEVEDETICKENKLKKGTLKKTENNFQCKTNNNKLQQFNITKRERNQYSDDSFYNTNDESINLNGSLINSDPRSIFNEEYPNTSQQSHENELEEDIRNEERLLTQLIYNTNNLIEMQNGKQNTDNTADMSNNNLYLIENEEVMEMNTNMQGNSLVEDDKIPISFEISDIFNNKTAYELKSHTEIPGDEETNPQPKEDLGNNEIFSAEEDKRELSEEDPSYKCYICAKPLQTSSEEEEEEEEEEDNDEETNEYDEYYKYQMQYPCTRNQLAIEVPCNEIRGSIPVKSEPSKAELDLENKQPRRNFVQHYPDEIFRNSAYDRLTPKYRKTIGFQNSNSYETPYYNFNDNYYSNDETKFF